MALTLTHILPLCLLMYFLHVCAGNEDYEMTSGNYSFEENELFSGYMELPDDFHENLIPHMYVVEDNDMYDYRYPEAEDVLRSKLTTVFLPVVYIIVFAVGLPANALAIWVFLFRMKKKTPQSYRRLHSLRSANNYNFEENELFSGDMELPADFLEHLNQTSLKVNKVSSGYLSVPPEAVDVLRSKLTTVFLPVVYIIVFAVGLPANALAIWVFLFRMKKKNPASIYMANLALADLLFVILVPLKIAYHFNGNDWIYGEALCKVLVAFFYGNMYCSILFITCISVQRYWAVAHPMSQLKRDNSVAVAVVMSVTVWVVVWAVSVPLYLYKQEFHAHKMGITTCHDVILSSQMKMAVGYFLTMGTLGFVVPLIVCIVSYVLTLKVLKNSIPDSTTAKKRKKAIRLIITALVMFIFCFTPSNIMLLVHYGLLLKGVENNLYGFYITTLCLASLNSCIDPFLYYFISEDFRDHVKNTFLCRSERTVERMRIPFSALKHSKNSSTCTYSTANTQSTDC